MLRRTVSLLVPGLALCIVGFALTQRTARARARTTAGKKEVRTAAGYPEATGINSDIEGVKAQVLDFNKRFSAALKRKDGPASLDLMASDWAYSNERGETISSKQWVAARVNPNKRKNLIFPFMQHVDIEWHVFGDNLVVETGRSNSTLYYKGKVSHGPRRETAVYVKIGGQWVIASLHVGFIPQEQRDFTFPPGAMPEGVTTPGPNSPPPKHRFLQMAGYAEAAGIDPQVEGVKSALLRLAAYRSAAMRKQDARALLDTMSGDWVYSAASGKTLDKAQWVHNVVTGAFRITHARYSDVEWHVFGDNLMVETRRSDSTVRYKGKVSRGPRRETAVYTKVDGKWVQASIQVGLIPGPQGDSDFAPGALPR